MNKKTPGQKPSRTAKPPRKTEASRKPRAGARATDAVPRIAVHGTKRGKDTEKAAGRGKNTGKLGRSGGPLGPTPTATPRKLDPERHRLSRETAEAMIDAAIDKKAFVPVLIDVSGRASYTDFICVVSGRSDRQVDAIAEGVTKAMKDRGHTLLGREGASNGRWTLLDFGDVVLHVFYHPIRDVYDIEGLWMDAPRVKLNVPPEAMHAETDALYAS